MEIRSHIPIHKKSPINEVNNYRGITLLNCFAKLFTKVINHRLCSWAETYKVYLSGQASFRTKHSTIDNIFNLCNLVDAAKQEGEKLFVLFIDFKKSFDMVVRSNLWYKLLKIGINGKVFNIVCEMYENVKTQVKGPNNTLGDEFACNLGVRPGETLSPFLFAMYINDVEEYLISRDGNNKLGSAVGLLKLYVLLYADDACILARSKEGLDEGMKYLYDYCRLWKMTLNTTKTKIIIFGWKSYIAPPEFKYNNETVEVVNMFCYLGVLLTHNLSWDAHVTMVCEKSLKACYMLAKYCYKYRLTVETNLNLLTSLLNLFLIMGQRSGVSQQLLDVKVSISAS